MPRWNPERTVLLLSQENLLALLVKTYDPTSAASFKTFGALIALFFAGVLREPRAVTRR